MKCRHCASALSLPFVDLGTSPPSNAYLRADRLSAPEKWYPLRVLVCESCWLVQTQDFTEAHELFDAEYAYFSSFSTSWVAHAGRYVEDMVARFGLSARSFVVEVAANDGYLLRHVRDRGIPCLGIEPTASTAAAARALGLDIVEAFFGRDLARRLVAERGHADLTAANNVLAHVPDINDFAGGFAILLAPDGVATFEFPWLLKLVEDAQFDTIYHEHFSYLSLAAVERVFGANGLTVFDVEQWPTHGGSLRVFAQRADAGTRPGTDRLAAVRAAEAAAGVTDRRFYEGFQARAEDIRNQFLRFLLDARRDGALVAGYGAAAKGNTLINFAGVRPDLLAFVVDRNPAKQGKFLPGSRIPVLGPEALAERRPDYILILPWNLKAEIMDQLADERARGARLVTAVPQLEVR